MHASHLLTVWNLNDGAILVQTMYQPDQSFTGCVAGVTNGFVVGVSTDSDEEDEGGESGDEWETEEEVEDQESQDEEDEDGKVASGSSPGDEVSEQDEDEDEDKDEEGTGDSSAW